MEVKGITARDFWQARKRIEPYITQTPLVYSPGLSKLTGSNIYLKLENLQDAGSFKIRGAANKILRLTEEERSRGISTFSTGNHGLAVAYMAHQLGIKATVCMSRHIPAVKVERMKRWKPVILQEWDSQEAAGDYCYAMEKKDGILVIPPFDDKEIICGQGSIGLEIIRDFPQVDTVLVPLSGGGLICGVTLSMKMLLGNCKITGISMEHSAAMIESIKAGSIVELAERQTLADSLLGGIGWKNRFTFDITRTYVDQTVQVSEEEIAEGIYYLMENHKMIVEGAAAVGIAYALRKGTIQPGKNVAVIVTGSGIGMEAVNAIISRHSKSKKAAEK